MIAEWLKGLPTGGSPPRVRGHDSDEHGQWSGKGITPAGAGTCDAGDKLTDLIADHPRGCGDMFLSFIFENQP